MTVPTIKTILANGCEVDFPARISEPTLVGIDDSGWLRYSIDEKQRLYVSLNGGKNFGRPPTTDELLLEPGTTYTLRVEFELEGGGAQLLIIEYDESTRLRSLPPRTLQSSPLVISWRTKPKQKSCCVAFRLIGTGRFRLRRLQFTRSSDYEEGRPIVDLEDVGVWYRLHRPRRNSILSPKLLGRRRAKAPVKWALRHVTFRCYEGDALGIVGDNGAGKSTLCLVLAKILLPDEGTATIRGNVPSLLNLGTGFKQDLTGRANILLASAFLGIPRRTMLENLDRIIEFSELGDYIDEPIRHYSTGMRARLGFAIATVLDPDILILDEVFAVGDRGFRAKSEARIEELIARSRLVVIVSHSLSLIRRICSHCVWLDHGELVRFGPADEILDAYEQTAGDDIPEEESGTSPAQIADGES